MDAMENLDSITPDSRPGLKAVGGAEMYPAEPQTLQELGLPELFLGHLALKHCFYMDFFTLGNLVERLKVSANIISEVLEFLKKSKWIEVRGPDPMHPVVTTMGLANRHSLTDAGRKQAALLIDYDAYAGPAPVVLQDYWRQVIRQTIHQVGVSPDNIQRILKGLVLADEIPEQLGVAAVSGKPLFLHGPPGNGKTEVCQRFGGLWEDDILVPYALFVDGQVIQVFDEITHAPSKVAPPEGERVDHRWLRCRRPVVMVAGELTLDMLDLAFNPTLKYFEAPLQLKANNGVFIVDDFGRQQISPQELLNRWIVPLETRQDFLRLRTGQKFAVPFDQFIIFATNLEPRSLMDEAFLRRLRSKVKVDYADRTRFAQIFQLYCAKHHVEFDPEALEYLLTKYYDDGKRPLTACHPRDLLEQIIDYCRYYRLAPRLSRENLDRACNSYFVS